MLNEIATDTLAVNIWQNAAKRFFLLRIISWVMSISHYLHFYASEQYLRNQFGSEYSNFIQLLVQSMMSGDDQDIARLTQFLNNHNISSTHDLAIRIGTTYRYGGLMGNLIEKAHASSNALARLLHGILSGGFVVLKQPGIININSLAGIWSLIPVIAIAVVMQLAIGMPLVCVFIMLPGLLLNIFSLIFLQIDMLHPYIHESVHYYSQDTHHFGLYQYNPVAPLEFTESETTYTNPALDAPAVVEVEDSQFNVIHDAVVTVRDVNCGSLSFYSPSRIYADKIVHAGQSAALGPAPSGAAVLGDTTGASCNLLGRIATFILDNNLYLMPNRVIFGGIVGFAGGKGRFTPPFVPIGSREVTPTPTPSSTPIISPDAFAFDNFFPSETDSLNSNSYKNFIGNPDLLIDAWSVDGSIYAPWMQTETLDTIRYAPDTFLPRWSVHEIVSLDRLDIPQIMKEYGQNTTVFILDSGGPHSMAMAYELAQNGWQPVPMLRGIPCTFDDCITSGADQHVAVALYGATDMLSITKDLTQNAPPAFIWDSHRTDMPIGNQIDNRYEYGISDMPDPKFLLDQGIKFVIYVTEANNPVPSPWIDDGRDVDSINILRFYQKSGLTIIQLGISPKE